MFYKAVPHPPDTYGSEINENQSTNVTIGNVKVASGNVAGDWVWSTWVLHSVALTMV